MSENNLTQEKQEGICQVCGSVIRFDGIGWLHSDYEEMQRVISADPNKIGHEAKPVEVSEAGWLLTEQMTKFSDQMTEENALANFVMTSPEIQVTYREIMRQRQKWGEQNHPSLDQVLLTREGGCNPSRMAEEYGIPVAVVAKILTDRKAKRGDLTYMDILLEEVCEAVEAGVISYPDESAIYEELSQVAAVALEWMACIRRRDNAKVEKGEGFSSPLASATILDILTSPVDGHHDEGESNV